MGSYLEHYSLSHFRESQSVFEIFLHLLIVFLLVVLRFFQHHGPIHGSVQWFSFHHCDMLFL